MLSKIQNVLLSIGAVLLLIVGAFFKGRSSGKESEQIKQDKIKHEAAKEVVKQVESDKKVLHEVSKNVSSASDSLVDDKLLNKWTRTDSHK